MDRLWKTIVYSLCGNTFPYSDLVTGFRLLDRLKRFSILKIELWTTISVNNPNKTQ